MSINKETELTMSDGGYEYLQNINLGELLTGELAGLNITFDRIKIPSGGGIVFEMPGETEDTPETAKEFTGVVLFHHRIRGYYQAPYEGGNNPPDCGSMNGITGVGDPGGNCCECPLDEFKTAANSNGKACREHQRIYVLLEGEVFPVLFSVPAGSLDVFSKYARRLVFRDKKKLHQVVTRFSLRKAKSKDKGIEYSQGVFAYVRDLTNEEKTGVDKFISDVRELAAKVTLQIESADSIPEDDDMEPLE